MTKILVIEDNEQFRSILVEFLKRGGYTPVEASNGQQAMSLIQQDKPDLVITDIIMPEKDGPDLISDLKKEFPDIKIIAMSGGGQDPSKEDLSAVATHYDIKHTFKKPFSMQDLLVAVKELTE